jgi:hypothetical protein
MTTEAGHYVTEDMVWKAYGVTADCFTMATMRAALEAVAGDIAAAVRRECAAEARGLIQEGRSLRELILRWEEPVMPVREIRP